MAVDYQKPMGDLATPRRYHAAAIVAHHMIIHGGLNEKNKYLGDTLLYDLVQHEWSQPAVKFSGLGEIAYHTMTAIYPIEYREHENFSIEFNPEIRCSTRAKYKVKVSGVYLFGGMFPEGMLNEHLWVLKTGVTPLTWTK
jgi:hypothetical protein